MNQEDDQSRKNYNNDLPVKTSFNLNHVWFRKLGNFNNYSGQHSIGPTDY